MVKDQKEIEEMLLRHGLSDKYAGFSYLASALGLALGGAPIASGLLVQVAEQTGRGYLTVYQAVQTGLRRMTGLADDEAWGHGEYVYYCIGLLHQELIK